MSVTHDRISEEIGYDKILGLELGVELGSGSLVCLEDRGLILGLTRQSRTRKKAGGDTCIDIGTVSVAEYVLPLGLEGVTVRLYGGQHSEEKFNDDRTDF